MKILGPLRVLIGLLATVPALTLPPHALARPLAEGEAVSLVFLSSVEHLKGLSAEGFHLLYGFPPGACVVRFAAKDPRILDSLPGVSSHFEAPLAPDIVARMGRAEQRACRIWNAYIWPRYAGLVSPQELDFPEAGRRDRALLPASFESFGEAGGPAPLGAPYGADFYDTSEFLIGSTTIGVVLPSSNGAIDPDLEEWTQAEIESSEVVPVRAADFWVGISLYDLSFVFDFRDPVPTSYEPILHDAGDEYAWVGQVMSNMGYGGGAFTGTRSFCNDLRDAYDTHWAVIMFLLDGTNDAGCDFPSGFWGFSYYGGPYSFSTFCDRPEQRGLLSHELSHNYYSLDEYSGSCACLDEAGYLRVRNTNCRIFPGSCGSGVSCIMRNEQSASVCNFTRGQIGIRDSDADGTPDILDVPPQTVLTPHSPDPAEADTAAYVGSATVVALNNQNPFGQGHDITLNTIALVEYRVDGGAWNPSAPTDGLWDEAQEDYAMTVGPLSPGGHVIETRAVDSSGNVDGTPAADTLTFAVPSSVGAGWVRNSPTITVYPNPVPHGRSVFFGIRSPSAVEISLYSSTGRTLRTISAPAGPEDLRLLRWDVRDEQRESLTSGVVFYRVRTGDEDRYGKIVLLP